MTPPEISAYLRALPERPPAPSTAEIVETLRLEARIVYGDVRWHRRTWLRPVADALRRAAKRLARLEDDALADSLSIYAPHLKGTCKPRRACPYCEGRADGIDAYRVAIRRSR